MYHQNPLQDCWQYKQAGNMEPSAQITLQGAVHFDVSVCSFWIFRLLWASWRKFCQLLFLLSCSEHFCFFQVAWLVWDCIGRLISSENDSEQSLLYIIFERQEPTECSSFQAFSETVFLRCLLLEITTFLHCKKISPPFRTNILLFQPLLIPYLKIACF